MRKYEIMFVVRPTLPGEELDKLIGQMEGVVAATGGRIEQVERMGLRRLAYRVRGEREGFYVLFALTGSSDTVKEFERRLKVSDAVIKYLTVRTDEALKRAEKRKALRAKREAKRPRPKPAPSPDHPAAAEAAQA